MAHRVHREHALGWVGEGGGVVKQRGTRAEAQAKKEYLKFA